MSNPQEIERELREYLEKEPNLRRDERLVYLRTIFNKHLEFGKLEHVVNAGDLFDIISGAKSNYTKAPLPMRISKRPIDSSELPHVAMIESFISYLNKMSLLRKVVRFDRE